MIGIVMPTYNQGKFLEEAVESIMRQTYRYWGLVVVDDCSTDDTPNILAKLAAKDKRIRVVRTEKNGGTGEALNLGFSHSMGCIETWFASDNVMAPHCLMTLKTALQMNPKVDFVYSDHYIYNMEEDGTTVRRVSLLSEEVGGQEWDPERMWLHYFLGIMWLWKRELREKAGPFQSEPCEDYDMTMKMMDAGGRFMHIPDKLGWFRRHSANMSAKIRGSAIDYTILVKERAAERRALR